MSLRLLVRDATRRDSLSFAWRAGAPLYRALGRIDAAFGARSWSEALGWLVAVRPTARISEIQFWGHGRWGHALIGDEPLDARALAPSHPLYPLLLGVRARLAGPDALWWWRTCETFGATAGQDFARAWSRFLGCTAAGHTYTIAAWQSGLHALAPGAEPTWPAAEGLAAGTPDAPLESLWSKRTAPSTVHCLTGALPASARS